MFKVVVDATPLLPRPSGVGLQVYNLICLLHNLQDSEEFKLEIVYQPSLKNWLTGNWSFPSDLSQFARVHTIPLPVRVSNLLATFPNPLLSHFEHTLGSPDIIHGTNYAVYPCRNSLKVLNIYDVNFIKHPNYVNLILRTYAQRVVQCLRWTDLVLTISESSKKDIVEYLGVDPALIQVTPLASRYSSSYLSEALAEQLEHSIGFDFSKPYLLFVSTIEPRKNVTGLIAAFNLLKQKYKIEHRLVLIGQKGWQHKPIFKAIENSPWRDQIHHLDYLSDELVALFYTKADVFVYPSHYEGFGMPVLEAMTLGVPVITSNTSSLPEVAGDAAILIDPNDETSLAEAILKVISDSQLRSELVRKGKVRAQKYSWEKNARETLKAYRSLLDSATK